MLYHYPVNHDRLIIGKFCSLGYGATFLFNSAKQAKKALSTYPFSIFYQQWNLNPADVAKAWDNKGDIIVGNDVWIDYQAVIMAGVTIGDGAIIGSRAVVIKDVAPYSVVGGVPARFIKKRFADEVIDELLEIKWWDWPADRIGRSIKATQDGDIEKLRRG